MKTESLPLSSTLLAGSDLAVLDVFGTRVTVLGGARETAGVFSLARIVCPPGTGAPPHTHAESEHFHVLRGRLTVHLGDEVSQLQPADTIHIAPGEPHAFANNSGEEIEFVSVATPAGHEEFFRDADELSRSGRFNPSTAAEVCRRHGITLL
ncbi:cupin domain-containing protein [bacterium]|nr:cupin domain-containing protein [bacterium]